MTTATARRSAPKKSAPAAAAAIALTLPTLAKGERYVGAVIGPDGRGEHCILLAGDAEPLTWSQAQEWAVKQGGTLPNRHELLLLWTHHRKEFKRDWYWSSEQYESDERWAWYQSFLDGYQGYLDKGSKLRARAVRRVPIR
jgi:hypothetical protein